MTSTILKESSTNNNFSMEEIIDYYKPYLYKIDDIILNCCQERFPLIGEIVQYLLESGGKRIRPLLTIISADLCNSLNGNALNLAAAIELIHTATLLHDDVIDGSLTRRNKPTVNFEWGNKTSILMGDFLFSQAFELMVSTKSMSSLQLLAQTSAIISEGEIIQLRSSKDLKIPLTTYYKIINSKTAVLFGAATKIGALISNHHQHLVNDMYSIGQSFGMAFQIIDDLLDYYRPTLQGGKNLGDDFFEGKVTLPIIKLYEITSPENKQFLEKIWNEEQFTDQNLQIIKTLIDQEDISSYVKQTAIQYLQPSYQLLQNFERNFASKALGQLLDFYIYKQI